MAGTIKRSKTVPKAWIADLLFVGTDLYGQIDPERGGADLLFVWTKSVRTNNKSMENLLFLLGQMGIVEKR